MKKVTFLLLGFLSLTGFSRVIPTLKVNLPELDLQCVYTTIRSKLKPSKIEISRYKSGSSIYFSDSDLQIVTAVQPLLRFYNSEYEKKSPGVLEAHFVDMDAKPNEDPSSSKVLSRLMAISAMLQQGCLRR